MYMYMYMYEHNTLKLVYNNNSQESRLHLVVSMVPQVIPPAEWCPRRCYNDIGPTVISTPVSQFVSGQQGVYQLYNIQKKAMSYSEFKAKATSDQ